MPTYPPGRDHSQAESFNRVSRPGISPECMGANHVRHVTAQEAAVLVGCPTSGVLLPYFMPTAGSRVPVNDPDGVQFCRLRKDGIIAGAKYHQPSNTEVHAYVPTDLETHGNCDTLIAVEGEFKSLSLTDRHLGFTIPAIGLSGFYGFHLAHDADDKDLKLVPELALAVDLLKPKRLAFLGDSDTSINWQFSHAAVRFKSLFPSTEIILPRIPIDQPKGIDDCRAGMGAGFERFLRRLLDDAMILKDSEEPDRLALQLLEPQLELASKFPASEKAKLLERIVNMGAQMGEPAREQLIKMVKKPMGMGITELRRMIKAKVAEDHTLRLQERLMQIRPRILNYHYTGRSYFRKYGDEHVPISGDENVLLAMRNDNGLTGCTPGADSDAELGLFLVQKENGIKWAGEVAGRPAGLLPGPSGKVLITRGPSIIPGATTGDASLIVELLLDFFGRSEGDPHYQTQCAVFCGWLRQARAAIRNPDDNLAGQALGLVGPGDLGKTFLPRHLIAPSLGGRYAECGAFFTGMTAFNSGLIGSELLHLSDVDPGVDEESRRRFRNLLKRFVANPVHMLEKKYADQISVEPVWRLIISLNRDSADLLALPRMDPSIRDKISLFACYRPPCLPSEMPAERQAFRAKIQAALPAFLGQIDATPTPENLRDGRFGVIAWHHPEVLRLLNESDPVALLGTFLDEYLGGLRADFDCMSAHDWFDKLAAKFGIKFTSKITDDRELGRLLGCLRDSAPEWARRVEQAGKELYGDQRNYRATWKISRKS